MSCISCTPGACSQPAAAPPPSGAAFRTSPPLPPGGLSAVPYLPAPTVPALPAGTAHHRPAVQRGWCRPRHSRCVIPQTCSNTSLKRAASTNPHRRPIAVMLPHRPGPCGPASAVHGPCHTTVKRADGLAVSRRCGCAVATHRAGAVRRFHGRRRTSGGPVGPVAGRRGRASPLGSRGEDRPGRRRCPSCPPGLAPRPGSLDSRAWRAADRGRHPDGLRAHGAVLLLRTSRDRPRHHLPVHSISGYGTPMALTLMRPEYDVRRPGEDNGTLRGYNPISSWLPVRWRSSGPTEPCRPGPPLRARRWAAP